MNNTLQYFWKKSFRNFGNKKNTTFPLFNLLVDSKVNNGIEIASSLGPVIIDFLTNQNFE